MKYGSSQRLNIGHAWRTLRKQPPHIGWIPPRETGDLNSPDVWRKRLGF